MRDGDIVLVGRREAEESESKVWKKVLFHTRSKVALAFLKMYTDLSASKLMEAPNGNIIIIYSVESESALRTN